MHLGHYIARLVMLRKVNQPVVAVALVVPNKERREVLASTTLTVLSCFNYVQARQSVHHDFVEFRPGSRRIQGAFCHAALQDHIALLRNQLIDKNFTALLL